MPAVLSYAIKFVADMDAAISFHTQHLGLKLRFGSPDWSEFDGSEFSVSGRPG